MGKLEPEKFMFIYEDGPCPGMYVMGGIEWPLPEIVFAKGYEIKGAYKKTFESKGKPKSTPLKDEYRGAKYTWDEDYEVAKLAK